PSRKGRAMILAETWAETWSLVLGSTEPGAETTRISRPRWTFSIRTSVLRSWGLNCLMISRPWSVKAKKAPPPPHSRARTMKAIRNHLHTLCSAPQGATGPARWADRTVGNQRPRVVCGRRDWERLGRHRSRALVVDLRWSCYWDAGGAGI